MFELSDWQRRAATQRFIDQALIGGRQRPAASGATFDAIDPASNRLLARVAACDAADVDAAGARLLYTSYPADEEGSVVAGVRRNNQKKKKNKSKREQK
ncbi:hypothetical protein KZ940_30880, partial [Pseudomonas aeruginosa]|nr:hypothetical protein [Pseudomonas aeruginosa]